MRAGPARTMAVWRVGDMRVRSRDEVERALAEQRLALKASCESYDAGNEWEAKRLALSIYILVSDGLGRSRSKSILSQLGMKNINFKDSSRPPFVPEHFGGYTSEDPPLIMCAHSAHAGPRYYPRCQLPYDMFLKDRPFGIWWEQVIFNNKAGMELSRKNLIMAMRNQDNGAHFDEAISTPAYLELAEKAHGRRFFLSGGSMDNPASMKEHEPPANAHLATVRQIAFEVDVMLCEHFQDRRPVMPPESFF